MEKRHEYRTSTRWTERRNGIITSPGLPALTVGAPPDFGGDEGVWSPEHFFVASAEVCIMLTFMAIAGMSKVDVAGWRSAAKGEVSKAEGKGFMFTNIEIKAEILLARSSDVEKAEHILRKAEQHCLVTQSVKTPVEFRYTIKVTGV